MADEQNRWILLIFVVVLLVLTIFAIVFVQQGRRNVPVMYPGRRMGNRMSMPVKGTLPLMVNMAGMIPLIFANSLLTFPAIIASFFASSSTPWVANLSAIDPAHLRRRQLGLLDPVLLDGGRVSPSSTPMSCSPSRTTARI